MADPSAGGSSSTKSEPKSEYDEELDFFSYKFNPERALYAPDISVPDPHIKSFETVKHYEDAVKARSKSKVQVASQKGKTSETHAESPRQTEIVAPAKTQEYIFVAGSSSEASTSCDERRVSLASKDRRVDRQGKLPLASFSRAGSDTTEEGALDLSLKTPSALPQAVPKRVAKPAATSLENYGNPPSSTFSGGEEKQYQTSVEDKIRKLLSSSRSQSSHEKPSMSSRNTESRILETPSSKSQSTASSDSSGHKLVTNRGVQNWPSNYEEPSPRTFIKQESDFIYVPSSERHARVSGLTDERRSHSASSHSAEKHHFDTPKHQERSSSRDTHKLSRYKEKSPDVLVRIQERSSHASTYSQRPPSWKDDSRRSTSTSSSATERQEFFDNRKVRMHSESERKLTYQFQPIFFLNHSFGFVYENSDRSVNT